MVHYMEQQGVTARGRHVNSCYLSRELQPHRITLWKENKKIHSKGLCFFK